VSKKRRKIDLTFDPKGSTKQLVDFLINVVPVYEMPDSASNEIAAQEHYYDGANIAAGEEDLASYVVDLFGALDAIRDDGERHRAHVALYRVIYGTYLITKSGTYPLGVERYSHDAQARVTRWGKERQLAQRNAIVLSVVAEYEKKTGSGRRRRF
jgi:hypothetical protein